MTPRFEKQILEATNLAHERGHSKISVRVAGRSHTQRGQYAVLSCDACSACSTVREKPYPDESDLEGTLHKQSCNVATRWASKADLISSSAEAIEIIGEDELERSTSHVRACANQIP